MSAQIHRLVAREARFQLANAEAIDVRVDTDEDGETTRLDAELIDISEGGVRLRSDAPVPEDDSLTITVTFKGLKELPNPLTIRAQVCWATLASKGCFYLGCSIEPAIPQVLLDHLAACGILERRQEIRHETAITLPARWELDRAEWEATILNISTGGMCVLIPQKGHVGDRMRLTLADENQESAYVYVKARWQIGTEDGYVLGCDFGDRASYLRLVQIANAQAANAVAYNPLLAN
jgi:hypothetical protein